ncbi:immunoglobulin lambda-1 light chain-like [Carcharodon carcharias]|uniref:immunoglobulin lambda-1 light chain-like n=1 Tax=Carcharodon carcharias TaxID=13397 RepID=UPI001B7E90C0|nr:immunoglobulin lambda-1 light chain-like [Carcharodon carcharias]
MNALEGESVTMECRYSRKTDDRYLIWGYVPPRSGAIQGLVYWSPGSRIPTFVSGKADRYEAVKDFARKRMTLRIVNATKQDSSRYFCQLTDHQVTDNRTDFCSCGSTLNVQAVPPSSPPSVHLQYPPPGEISADAPTSLLCLVTGFYPPPVQISWYLDGSKVLSGISEWPLSRDPQDRYTSVSRLEIRSRDWVDAGSYQCVVSHPKLKQPIMKEIRTSAHQETLVN